MGFSKGPVIVLDVSLLGTFDSLEGIEGMGFSKGPVIVLDVSLLGTFDSLEGIEGMGFSKGPVIFLELPLSNADLALERSPFIIAWDDSKEDCCCATATCNTEVWETYIK